MDIDSSISPSFETNVNSLWNNPQSCASHLILATYISQNPTDDYDLPIVTNLAMKNVGFKFKNLLADAGYSNELVIDYLQKSKIEGFIPNATQSRENKDELKINPVSKDNV